ncbi:MAG: hypothetical protein MJZ76_05585, partial [Bacteroidales bacterium]|nr:hypothetical protein [Bacteroidales bacterium]
LVSNTNDTILNTKIDSVMLVSNTNDTILNEKIDSVMLVSNTNDTILNTKIDSVMNVSNIHDSINTAKIDSVMTVSNKQDSAIMAHIADTLSNYMTIAGLCDSIANCGVITNLQDSMKKIYEKEKADSLRIAKDSINLVKNYITSDSIQQLVSDSLKTMVDFDSVKVTIHDSIVKFLTSDSIQQLVSDSLNNYVTLDKLNDTIKNFIVSDSIQQLVSDSLSKYMTTEGLCDSIANCGVITNLQDSMTKIYVKEHTDSLVLATRMDTLLKHVCDSVKDCVAAQISDSLDVLRDTIESLRQYVDSLNSITIKGEESVEVTPTAGQTEFAQAALNAKTPIDGTAIKAFLNGIRVPKDSFTYDKNAKKFVYDSTKNGSYILKATDRLTIEYLY